MLLKLAWRNLWRNTRRTIATTGAMTLALLVTMVYAGLIEGFLVNMEKDTLDFEIGSVQIFAKGYQTRPSLYTYMTDADGIVEKLGEQGIHASSRLLGAGLVAFGDSSAGVQFRGIDVGKEKQVLLIHEQVAQGSWLDKHDKQGVVLGRNLASTLTVKPGDEIVVLSQAADGSMANDLFNVRGILRSVGETTDRAGLFMTKAAFRDLMVFQQGAHQIIVRRPASVMLSGLKANVSKVVAKHDVKTWRELMPVMATYVDSARGMVKFMFFILNIVVGIVILNAMLMAVFERIREFGIFKAVGAGPVSVVTLILYESMLQVLLAIISGVILSLPLLWYLSAVGINMQSLAGVSVMGMAMMTHWKVVVDKYTFITPILMLIFVVGLAVIYPALKAALVKPIEAMRHQ